MRVCVFASGSDGNCLLISESGTNVLLDAGISMRRVENSLAQAGISMRDVGGVLITHEHSDHISGLKMLLKHYQIEIFAPHTVAGRLIDILPDAEAHMHIIPVGEHFKLGCFDIFAFHTSHDTDESVGYRVSGDGVFAIATDTGCVTDEIISGLTGADTVLVESNHDERMLIDGPYPVYLKRRILSDTGHLSNEKCAALARRLADSGTRRFILGHLSRTNNTPALAHDAAAAMLRDTETEVFCAPVYGFMEFDVGERAECCL